MATSDITKTPRISVTEKHQVQYNVHLETLKNEFFTDYNVVEVKTVCRDVLDIYGSVGRGEQASMLLSKHKINKTFHVLKRLNKVDVIKNNRVRQVFLQKQVLGCVKFPFLLNLEMTTKDFRSIFLIYPFMYCGDFHWYLHKQKTLKERDAIFYSSQIILALEYMHKLGLIYRNLKPENILFCTNGYVKISDYRFIKFVNDLRTYTLCGTPEYLAPEMIMMKGYGKSVDWWTLGIFIFEMIAGFTPFYSPDPMKIAENALVGKYKYTENFTQKARHLIKNILQVDISKRFGNLKNGVNDIKYHNWFQIIDWQAIYNQRAVAPFTPSPVHDVKHIMETSSEYLDDPNCPYATSKEFEFF